MLCLRLQGQPPEDAVDGTLLAWREVLGENWTEASDAPRVQEAFRTLMRTCTHWPAPADFLDAFARIADECRPSESHAPRLSCDESNRIGKKHISGILRMLGIPAAEGAENSETRQ